MFHQGAICGHVRKYSDGLLMFLIKQADPSYREHFQIDHSNPDKRPFLFKMTLHPDAVKAARANSNQQRINDDPRITPARAPVTLPVGPEHSCNLG